MHIRHSDFRHGELPMGSSPPWQCSRQRLQLLHAAGSLSSPSTDHRETAPSNAPSGQIERHQNRVMRKLIARITRNKTPRKIPCVKCACRNSNTTEPSTAWINPPVALIAAMWLCSIGVRAARTT